MFTRIAKTNKNRFNVESFLKQQTLIENLYLKYLKIRLRKKKTTFFFNVYSSDLVSNKFRVKISKNKTVFYDFENPYTINLKFF